MSRSNCPLPVTLELFLFLLFWVLSLLFFVSIILRTFFYPIFSFSLNLVVTIQGRVHIEGRAYFFSTGKCIELELPQYNVTGG